MTTTSSAKRLLFVDIETYSEVDLKKCGAYRYVDDPSFEVMLFAYAYDDEPVTVVDFAQGEKLPDEVLFDMASFGVIKVAHNANFERTCLTKWLGLYMHPAQWYCTAVRAATLGLPRSLEAVGEVLGLKEDEKKMAIGKRLIQYFAKPCAPTKTNGGRRRNLPHHEPEKWALYKEYNKQDVATERVIFNIMKRYPPISKEEHELWALDQWINEQGVLIDTELVGNIITYSERHEVELEERAKQVSGIDNPSSFPQMRRWLARKGLNPDTLDKDSVKKLIVELGNTEPDVVEFLKIRQELGKTSITKYDAIERALCSDNRVRGTLQFYGANRTGRWAGRIIQPQNLPQNKMRDLDLARRLVKENDFDLLEMLYDSPFDVFSQLIRTALIANTAENKTFAVADYSAIEARVIAWLAGEEWRLESFREGKDIYCASASQMFGVPVIKNGENGHLRKKGKVAELACGYQGSIGAMKRMGAEEMGLSDEEIKQIVDNWRDKSPRIVELWKKTESAAKKAILHPGVEVSINQNITFRMIGEHLFVTLPSGRKLCYQSARVVSEGTKTAIKYKGQNQTTQKWEEVDTYGGKLVENITQATARDCLGAAMLRLNQAGYCPEFHVHDEVIIEVDKATAEKDLKAIEQIMALDDLEWKEGLPLVADGYLTDYYKKD